MKLPTIRSYGEYSSSNYGAHCLCVNIGPLTVWYSYQTPVAFQLHGPRIVIKNYWSTTTGKHLNWIDGGHKKSRVGSEEFQRLWDEQVAPLLAADACQA